MRPHSGWLADGLKRMRALSKFFSPLRQAAEAFFKHDLALRRDAAGLQIVLEARPAAPKEPGTKPRSGKPASAQREQEVLALMLEQLGALLAEVPSTRSALPHLGFVEQALRKKGLRALDKLPLEVLQRALEQLESLVTNWSPVGLASLRSKMAVAIIGREQMAPEQQAAAEAEAGTNESRAEPAEIDALVLSEQEANENHQALAAAYAALSPMAPTADIEFQMELGSPSSKAIAPRAASTPEAAGELRLIELEA